MMILSKICPSVFRLGIANEQWGLLFGIFMNDASVRLSMTDKKCNLLYH